VARIISFGQGSYALNYASDDFRRVQPNHKNKIGARQAVPRIQISLLT